jgi:alpha-L-fucosidase 2
MCQSTRFLIFLPCFAAVLIVGPLVAQQPRTTAWRNNAFHLDRPTVIGRSDIILERTNEAPGESMPLGNGRLGLAVWGEQGFTAQLNRGDTFPLRLSPGQVVVPGLKKLTAASDYKGRLDLYNGEFRQHGAGMVATTYVAEALDIMVIDVTGADPLVAQSAELSLWSPRRPVAATGKGVGFLSETWLDDKEAGSRGETFGSLAAIAADADGVQIIKSGELSVKITFRPHPDGSFRILVGAPQWKGGNAAAKATKLMAAARKLSSEEHRTWWHTFWAKPGLMLLSSPDHAAEYLENLRLIDLFTAAAESRDRFPGSQAGIGDLFSSIRDEHKWGPSAYWHWNLRMQVGANLGAGLPELNQPYFALYRENLDNILAWTKLHMSNRAGICVPETMRFNGAGWENETWIPAPAMNCGDDANSKPYYNARTISTGAEVSLWIWQQYLFTDDRRFLVKNYPVMRESARFLLAYANHEGNGRFHTFPSNAHETKWDVHDPTTDVSAVRTLFPATIAAATLMNVDAELVAQLRKELLLLPELPVVSLSSPSVLVQPRPEDIDTIIAPSYDLSAVTHNVENIGLEPVWPYGIIGDSGPLHSVAVRTFNRRPNKNEADWSADPVQAARLGLADEFRSSLLALTERYQTAPSGLASFMGPEFYVEQLGVLADALQTALVQDYDGLIRIAPAWPKDWSADATIAVQHGAKVDLQVRDGEVITFGIEVGTASPLKIRNPWPGHKVKIFDGEGNVISDTKMVDIIEFLPIRGRTYMLLRADRQLEELPYAPIVGASAVTPKSYGLRTIGIRSR